MNSFVFAPKPRNGVMLAWYPPIELRERLAIPGGEAVSELHVTLLYFGRFGEVDLSRLGELRDALSIYCDTVAPMEGEITGWGRFSASDASDGKDPLIALVSVPRFHVLRTELEELCNKKVAVKPSKHGFMPHMTLDYLTPGEESPISTLARFKVRVEELTLKVGGLSEEFPLGGV